MVKIIFAVLIITIAGFSAYAEDEKLGRDDFLSSSLSDVFDKVGKYTSGEKDILLSDEEGKKETKGDYDTDALGRKVPQATIRSGTTSSADKKL